MSKIDIFGAGAFGTALAIVLARNGTEVSLWAREGGDLLKSTRKSPRLPAHPLPNNVRVVADVEDCDAPVALIAVPTPAIAGLIADYPIRARTLVSCAKGIDAATGLGPARILARHGCIAAQLSGPSFADDIAAGLPTALTLACADRETGMHLQKILSTPKMRLYRGTDVTGVEIGGALKNVIAIACGVCIGAGFGNSARAALMSRGFAEMQQFALAQGADVATLSGLSGLGDLALSCYSEKSRNFRRGLALGQKQEWQENTTVEGVRTAHAVLGLARERGIDVPIIEAVVELLEGQREVGEAMEELLRRPLRKE